ncbi:MAG: rhodoquinone biosynthesis methyltransferase RquA [Gammaproteobacteria bacterium]|nr:rhodoquinone biosynthesis methyltransferase RquA [Gammaproteobacteria bacterium]
MLQLFKIHRHFQDGIPDYLARHYWWAYLWRPAIWFFDHEWVINLILFTQYRQLKQETLKLFEHSSTAKTLQLTCVYGSLTPTLLQKLKPSSLFVCDVSHRQLEKLSSKIDNKDQLHMTRMNAEHLAYKDNSFSSILVFFLLHELPDDARLRVLAETLRVLQPGGTLICTEYGNLASNHFLHRFAPIRWSITWLEPFLDNFWRQDLVTILNEQALPMGKTVQLKSKKTLFSGFYQILELEVIQHKNKS